MHIWWHRHESSLLLPSKLRINGLRCTRNLKLHLKFHILIASLIFHIQVITIAKAIMKFQKLFLTIFFCFALYVAHPHVCLNIDLVGFCAFWHSCYCSEFLTKMSTKLNVMNSSPLPDLFLCFFHRTFSFAYHDSTLAVLQRVQLTLSSCW